MARFSANNDEILLDEIQKYPPLYDYEDSNYKNFIIKENGWKNVSIAVGKDVDDCKKRWRNIKDTYFRHTKKLKLGTGSSSCDKPIKWTLYNRLAFLSNVKHKRTSKSTLVDESRKDDLFDSHHETESAHEDESTWDDSEFDVHPPTPRTQSIGKKSTEDLDSSTCDSRCSTPIQTNERKSKTRKLQTSFSSEFHERAQKRMDLIEAIHKNSQKAEKEDDVDLFMKSVSMSVKKLPRALINEAKLAILTLVDNLEQKAATYVPPPVSGRISTPLQLCNSNPQKQNNAPILNPASTSIEPSNSLSSFFYSYNPEHSNPSHNTPLTYQNITGNDPNFQ